MARGPATVAVEVLHALLARSAAAGWAPGPLLSRFGATPAIASDPEGRVPAALVRALWMELPELCDDPQLGLHLARAAPDAALGLVASVVLHAPTLGDGLRAAVRYARVLQDVARCHVETTPRGGLRFVQTPPTNGPVPPRHAVEFGFARAILMARRSTGVEVSPTHVRFAFARPPDLRAHQDLFRAPLTFGHPRNELDLDSPTLRLAPRAADPQLRRTLERHAAAVVARLGGPLGLGAQLGSVLCARLPMGEVDLTSVAGALDVSRRTLQRRLTAEGLSYRELVDEARLELAERYLADPAHSLAQITLLLGFSEQAAFQRAFRRWKGLTPGQFRARQRRATAPSS